MELKEYIIKNECLEVHVCSPGGIIKNILVRDGRWKLVDVVLGFDTIEQYAVPTHPDKQPYPGTITGSLDNQVEELASEIGLPWDKGEGGDHPCGEASGPDEQTWRVEQPDDEHLILHHADTTHSTVRYSIEQNVLRITEETSGRATHANITCHPYFNLEPNDETIGNHGLRLYSTRRLELTPERIPTGDIIPAEGKYAFHFNKPLFLALQEDGIDDYYVYEEPGEPQLMAELTHPKNGITVTILSDAPALRVYTGKRLQVAKGKGGREYTPFSGIALEPRTFPASPHSHTHQTKPFVPEETYRYRTVYSLTVSAQGRMTRICSDKKGKSLQSQYGQRLR